MNESIIALLEEERKKLFFPIIVCIAAGVITFFTAIGLMSSSESWGLRTISFPLSFFLGVILSVLLYFLWVNRKIRKYKELYKDMVVTKQFREVFENCSYEPEYGITKEEVRATGLIMLGNRYKSEDYLSGTYKNVRFERSDVLIQNEETDGHGHSHTTTYFQGRWLVLQPPKSFQTTLQIIQRGFSHSNHKKGFFTRKDERRHEVEFENETFNSMFTCYCQNDQEAYYLITPQMQEAILKLVLLIDGKLMIGFTGKRMHLAIHNGKDALEPPIFRAISYQNDILATKQEIRAITDVVNILNLDRDLYKTI